MEILNQYHLPLNPEPPRIMHIDLNSCFATVMQQSHKQLRGKPVLIAAYNSPRGCVLAPSIEAKRYGIKTGDRVADALRLAPHAIVRTADTAMIRDVHMKFKRICLDYSPHVAPRSIDEVVIDFHSMRYMIQDKTLLTIGREIKQRLKQEVGSWMVCSVGIAPNRFLAKVASSYQKPDGLTYIDHTNLLDIYDAMELIDLPYIKYKNQARLKSAGIFTVREFLNASSQTLEKIVFKSIVGNHWYKRLRGWEVDDIEWERKTIGQEYSLRKATAEPKELARLLMKLCEKMGRRLRRHGKAAHGIHVGCSYRDYTHWHQQKKSKGSLYTTLELYKAAQYVLDIRPNPTQPITKLSVHCYDLQDAEGSQASLFEETEEKLRKVSQALDTINDRYGEFVITPASMMSMDSTIIDRIAFGGSGIQEIEN